MPYQIAQPPFTLEFRKMSEDDLRRYFHWFAEILPQRIDELARAVGETTAYENWQPDCTPSSLDGLGHWFATQVQARNRTSEELETIRARLVFAMDISGEELTNKTFSLALDIGMYLGQVLMKNHPSLRWVQPLGSKNFADYGQPSITGFGRITLNPVRIATTLAYGLASKAQTGKRLREVYEYWAQRVE